MTIMDQSAVLLLNASFEPIKRITVRDAAELILRNAPHLVALAKIGVKFPKGEAEMLQPEPTS
jgi:hypothetical protein